MAEPPLEANIETVHGQLSDDRAQQVLEFWARHGALQGAAAHERLREVVCLALGADGEIVGVNSVFPHNLALIGGRPFWVYRSRLAPDAGSMVPEMINSAFATLEGEFNQKSEGPIGLCVLVADRAEMERHPETVWPTTQLMFAGYTADNRQARVRYFQDAVIEPGTPESQTASVTASLDYGLSDRYRIERLDGGSSVTHDDVLALWRREGVVTDEESSRRVGEVLNVGDERDEGVVGVSTAYLNWNHQLRMNLWYYRSFVAERHRQTHVAAQLLFSTRDHLERRFLEGDDTRAPGIAFELEYEPMRKRLNGAIWLPADFRYVGDNARGQPVRVHYFPGTLVPTPG